MSRRQVVVDRRTFVRRTLGASVAAAVAPFRSPFGQAPAIVRTEGLAPMVTHGVAAGDVHGGRAVVWSRADRASRLIVEYSTTERFANPFRVIGPAALEGSDFTARVVLTDLPPGQRMFYRVIFQDLSDIRSFSQPAAGSFLTPQSTPDRDVTVAFSADTVGQGWGINPDWGGLRLYETMHRAQPDVFINLGDTIYADQPVEREVKLDDGTVWKNLVTEGKSKPAQTHDDFRAAMGAKPHRRAHAALQRRGAGNLMWDDHEVRDNWYRRERPSDERYPRRASRSGERARGVPRDTTRSH